MLEDNEIMSLIISEKTSKRKPKKIKLPSNSNFSEYTRLCNKHQALKTKLKLEILKRRNQSLELYYELPENFDKLYEIWQATC